MFKQCLGLVVLTSMSNLAYADLTDPTRPAYPLNPQTTIANTEGEAKLSAIWISAKSRLATINGVRAKQGQTIPGGIKIIKIYKNAVVIYQNRKIKTLQLLHRPYRTQ